jgi:peptidoglycan glycosyltransferase
MNKAILRVSLACLALFVLLMLNINYVQAFEANSLADKPGNARTFDEQFSYQRGSILADGDGTNLKIAYSKLKGDAYHRVYPHGPEYAPITGYSTIFSQSGVEQAENKELAGTDPRLAVRNFTSLLTGKQKQGATVTLTISPIAQNAAYQALVDNPGNHPAAVVALNPQTGAILAMASYPSYNPNELTTFNGVQLNKVDNRLLRDPSQPLLNRAVTPNFPPGSSFKIVTGSAAFTHGLVASPSTTIPAPTVLTLPNGNLLHNDGDEPCANGNPPISEAFLLSCNTAFAKLGIRLSAPALRAMAEKFGVNKTLDIPFSVTPGSFPPVPDNDKSYTAMSAIGQFNDEVSPLQEAMFAAAIANNGKLMSPYMVDQVLAPGLAVIQNASPAILSQAVSPTVAGYMKTLMLGVTQNPDGTAYQTAGPPATSIPIYGKTGTAENGVNNAGLDDAVFSCFVAPGAGHPYPIAVGVIVKGGGFGADAAAPIAVKIIKAYEARS